MAKEFHRGSTIKCTRNVKDSDGNYCDPSTSFKISITDRQNGVDVSDADMVQDATGKYHYYFTSAIDVRRKESTVTLTYIATDGTNKTVYKTDFKLV